MIEAMKKVVLVALDSDREATLKALRDLEIMHIRESREESSELSAAVRACEDLQALIYSLKPFEDDAAEAAAYSRMTPAELATKAGELMDEYESARDNLVQLRRNIEELKPWGNFDPDTIRELRDKGMTVALCKANEQQLPELPDSAVMHTIHTEKGNVFFAVISPEPMDRELPEVRLPAESLPELQAKQEELERRSEELNAELAGIAACAHNLETALLERRETADYRRAHDSIDQDERLIHLSGYVPDRRVADLKQAAKNHGWALQVSDPEDNDRTVPTLLRVPKWLEVSRPIFDFVGIRPGYREFDVSSWFLIFLTIFFAIIYGDGGYGVIFLGLAAVAKVKAPKKAQMALNLILLFSVATIVWGVLSGNWFSIPNGWQETQKGDDVVWVWREAATRLPRFMCGLQALQDTKNVQYLCLLIGAIHLTIAHVWKLIVAFPSLKFLSQAGWTSFIWANFFLGSKLIAAKEPLIPVAWLYIGGAVLILLFTSPGWALHKTIGKGFASILGGGINSFVDVLSYIRLFAVGLSSYYVAMSFNKIGMMLFGGEGVLAVVGMIAGVLVILFGHVLNITLGGLGVLVHGIRLNTLEFSGHIGIEWAGIPFRPFARRKKD